MGGAWRSTAEASVSLGLIAMAAVLTLVGRLLSLILIPLTLIAVIAGVPALDLSAEGLMTGVALLSFPAALTMSLYLAVSGLEVMNDPTWGGIGKLALLAAGVLLAGVLAASFFLAKL
jgi:hypothetical protein